MLLCLEIISCIPFIYFLGNKSPVYVWFMYCFPVFRAGDFFVGCVLERVYFENDLSRITTIKASVCEIITLALTVLVSLWMAETHINNYILLLALSNSTTLFIPLAAMWVCLFVLNKGIITRIFVNKAFVFLGNISAYIFLIHYVVSQYINCAIRYFDWEVNGLYRIMLVGIELMMSVLLSIWYKRIHNTGLGTSKNSLDHFGVK